VSRNSSVLIDGPWHHRVVTAKSARFHVAEAGDGPLVLFLHGAYDATCETLESGLAAPMRAACADLTEVVVQSGHWMAQEQPVAVNAALARWLATKLPAAWPAP